MSVCLCSFRATFLPPMNTFLVVCRVIYCEKQALRARGSVPSRDFYNMEWPQNGKLETSGVKYW